MYGSFGLPLFYLIPALIAINIMHEHIYINTLHPLLIIASCLLIDILLCKGYILSLSIAGPYTVGAFFGSILVTALFSLKFRMGKMRQPLMLN